MAEVNNSEVVESSTTTTSSTTKVIRRVRRTSRSRSPSPSRGRSRSPSRRKSLNRSPSPHRYNTRTNVGTPPPVEETDSVKSSGCCVSTYLSCVCSTLSTIKRKYQSLVLELVKCSLYITLAYIALTMCSFGKCDIRYPTVPKLNILYNEKVFVECAAWFVISAVIFSLPLGQVVTGVPTDRGTLSYLCNSGPALLLTLALSFGAQHYDPSLLDPAGKEVQFLFSTLVVVLITAVCVQWQFASFGTIYNVVAGAALTYLIEQRFHLTSLPPCCFSGTVLMFGVSLNTYALIRTLFRGPSNCASTCASRGLLILVVTWSLFHSHFPRPEKACLLNTAALMSSLAIIVTLTFFIYRHRECAKASAIMILLTGVTTGVLVQQNYLAIPSTLPALSIWYCVNVGSVLDALFVLVRGDYKTNFLGFKPVDFVRKVFEGKHDPRYNVLLFTSSTLDLKFFCIRLGHMCPTVFCVIKGVELYKAGTYPCILSTVLAMTFFYSLTKLVRLEKAITSSSDVVERRCSVGFMIWSLCVQPNLTLFPLKYMLSAPADSLHTTCNYHMCLMVATFLFGLVVHSFSTLQGHYLLIGETHWMTRSLTTLAANGGEQIPVSGLWRFMRYPFITGDIMATASIALFCGCEAPLLYLPLTVLVVLSLLTVRSYNKISPAFYGVRAWNSYQQMVKFNIIPGVY
ncbi:hypothetical protein ACHWQZ_G002601 [Mnemiopsis leidyi]